MTASASAPIEIVVRRPEFEYHASARNWMPNNPDFGYRLNGGSLTLPYLEPYLIRVMRQAKEVLGTARPELQNDIDLFNGQEANHFKLHRTYNALLRERYEGIEELEAEIEADFARFLREESLEWNLGYSAGFETTGMVTAQLYFRQSGSGMEGVDPAVHALWGWHLAEEYEHRCVAFDVFQALDGSYRRRLKLFFFQSNHLERFSLKAQALMRAQDEAAGHLLITPLDQAKQREVGKQLGRFAKRQIFRALMPWHNPRRSSPLAFAEDFLGTLDFQ
jgi:hypothetical protein